MYISKKTKKKVGKKRGNLNYTAHYPFLIIPNPVSSPFWTFSYFYHPLPPQFLSLPARHLPGAFILLSDLSLSFLSLSFSSLAADDWWWSRSDARVSECNTSSAMTREDPLSYLTALAACNSREVWSTIESLGSSLALILILVIRAPLRCDECEWECERWLRISRESLACGIAPDSNSRGRLFDFLLLSGVKRSFSTTDGLASTESPLRENRLLRPSSDESEFPPLAAAICLDACLCRRLDLWRGTVWLFSGVWPLELAELVKRIFRSERTTGLPAR